MLGPSQLYKHSKSAAWPQGYQLGAGWPKYAAAPTKEYWAIIIGQLH